MKAIYNPESKKWKIDCEGSTIDFIYPKDSFTEGVPIFTDIGGFLGNVKEVSNAVFKKNGI